MKEKDYRVPWGVSQILRYRRGRFTGRNSTSSQVKKQSQGKEETFFGCRLSIEVFNRSEDSI